MYEQAGWMPTFPQVFGNHLCMNSYHSSAIFIDGYRKGLIKYDVEKAYQGIKKNLLERLPYPIFITEFKVPVINIEDLVEEIYLIIQNKKKPREVNIFEPNFMRLNELIFD